MEWQALIPFHIQPELADDALIFILLRAWRNVELSSTDWTQLPDAPVDKAAWAAYRQELRDLPAQKEDPKLIVFPERP